MNTFAEENLINWSLDFSDGFRPPQKCIVAHASPANNCKGETVKYADLRQEEDTLQSTHYLLQQGPTFMSLDLTDLSSKAFDDWLFEIEDRAQGEHMSEERLVQLVCATLREVRPESRAKGFVDLANMCYSMADHSLGSQTPATRCLEMVVNLNRRH